MEEAWEQHTALDESDISFLIRMAHQRLYDVGAATAAPRTGSGVSVEEIAAIKDALIQARGALYLDVMTDEAGKPYGMTAVAQEAIGNALALLEAVSFRETGAAR